MEIDTQTGEASSCVNFISSLRCHKTGDLKHRKTVSFEIDCLTNL